MAGWGDAAEYRRQSRKGWASVAGGWARHATRQMQAAMPVTEWMLDAARLHPGHQVLELAAGPGDVGFLAYELIQPGGTLICSDFSPEMLDQAQQRAERLGLQNVRFKQIDAESIDIPAASLDAVLCRWGFMLMADPGAALRECRRVLRPGGRLVLAAWAGPEDNPWSALMGEEMMRRGLVPPRDPSAPGQFSWGREGLIGERLEEAGFVDEIEVEAVAWTFDDEDFDGWWERTLAMSPSGQVVQGLSEAEREDLRTSLRETYRRFERPDGRLELPARSWVAGATA